MTDTEEWSWPLLHEAQRLALLDILVHGARSRADVARRIGLTRASLTRLTRDLMELGFITEGQIAQRAGRGRPSEMLEVVPSSAYFVGIKLTGDMLYAELSDLRAQPRAEREVVLRSVDELQVVDLIAKVVDGFRRTESRIAAVGVCLAGDVLHGPDGSAVVVGSHFLGWDEVALQELVSRAVGLPVAVSNDVQALTVGHHWFGAGVGTDELAVIGLGEGIGAGMIVGGELIRGARGHPGKVGHLMVSADGPMCDMGHVGCVSAYVTTPAILAATGMETMTEVLDAAARDDVTAVGALNQAIDALGAAVAHITNLVDPELVVIAGEGIVVARHDQELLAQSIARRLDPTSEPPQVVIPDFRFEDYARGAAVTALRQLLAAP
ncbi:ROK family transcriptional regulator [Homoserinibacter sp. GY 40078]|uniref:ROK family transcriptional regulator n=1 Tax=Homoserinibacter sp. GY 40078 TaxID=2603275 RepID=UPI0011CAE1F9|nr:ROK family transcriptional regulator [Homoserinibacter sp. GY 40078]TXK19387.1 ROK family transcriptional regulator [Homoserinibacter sp. GY 40078]